MEITLYTIGCPQCKMLEKQLDEKKVEYIKKTDIDEMLSLGIKHAPALCVDGKLMEVKEALKWVKSL